MTKLDQRDFIPLTAYRMPEPGVNYLSHAAALYPDSDEASVEIVKVDNYKQVINIGSCVTNLYYNSLYTPHYSIPVNIKGAEVPANILPGHLLSKSVGVSGFYGPVTPTKVMIIVKQPTPQELSDGRYLQDDIRELIHNSLRKYGITSDAINKFYVTGLVKWPVLNPSSSVLPKAQQKDCLPLLENEIRLLQPDVIVCFGSEASKMLLGTSAGVKSMVGNVLSYPVYGKEASAEEHEPVKEAKVIASISPTAVLRKPEEYDTFSKQMRLFAQLIKDEYQAEETFIDHRVIRDVDTLHELIQEIKSDSDSGRQFIAIDAEWHGEHPNNEDSYVRSIQFSTKHGEGITVELYGAGKETHFEPSVESAVEELKELFFPNGDWNPRIGGHFFRADLPWLKSLGLDLIPYYAPAEFSKCHREGGWDTSLMHHAVNEVGPFKLEELASKLLGIPRYDNDLQTWKKAYCKEQNIKDKDLDGYGMCPSSILYPYGCYDADVTRRLAVLHMKKDGLLDRGTKGENSWVPYWIAHRASVGFLEMEQTGLVLDLSRLDTLSELYESQYGQLLANFVTLINWPDFNPNSTQQCAALLFGGRFNYKHNSLGEAIEIAPEGARLQSLTPIKATGKRAPLWDDLVRQGDTAKHNPSTDSHVLGILSQENEIASKLLDLKIISKVLSGPIRRANRDDSGVRLKRGDSFVYSDGLYKAMQDDGKVHTSLFQTKETGRASSANPPLQNITKKREADYSRILGDAYSVPIRSVLKASPGCVLVEADYTGAELAVMAWVSNDTNMIEHVRRNGLPEDDPNHYDMHSNTAVNAFNLRCEPSKTGLKESGNSALRIAAKAVNFGGLIENS